MAGPETTDIHPGNPSRTDPDFHARQQLKGLVQGPGILVLNLPGRHFSNGPGGFHHILPGGDHNLTQGVNPFTGIFRFRRHHGRQEPYDHTDNRK